MKTSPPGLMATATLLALLLLPQTARSEDGDRTAEIFEPLAQARASVHRAAGVNQDALKWLNRRPPNKRSRAAAARGRVRQAAYQEEIQVDGAVGEVIPPILPGPPVTGDTFDGPFVDGPFVDGTVIDEGFVDGGYVEGPYEEYVDSGCGACPTCDGDIDGGCVCVPRILGVEHVEVFGGVQGFKGPADRVRNPNNNQLEQNNGNFGFHEGFNLSGPLRVLPCRNLAYQFGYRGVHSNLSGTQLSEDSRDQSFFTGGLFVHKPLGLNFGVAWDYLRDEYLEEFEVQQIRAQFSLRNQRGHEIGLWTAASVSDDLNPSEVDLWEATDQFVLFYQWLFDTGVARLWAGGTSTNDGLVGGDALVSLSDRWSLALATNYLIPEEPSGSSGATHEAWNVGISLVWHWRCHGRSLRCSPYRPMFSVADNGTLFTDFLQR